MDVMESLEILWELNTPVKEKFGRRKTAATRWTDVVSSQLIVFIGYDF